MNLQNLKEKFLSPQNKNARIAVIAASVLSLIFFIWYFHEALTYESTDDAFVEGHVIPISSKVSAHAVKVYVQDNQQVKKGDLLAELDDADYKIKLAMSKAELEAASAQAEQANANVKRYEKLHVNNEISKQQFDQSQIDARIANAKEDDAKSRVEQAELQLSYTKIYAPEAGFVTKKGVELGAYIIVGQPLMALVPTDVWVIANFKETQVNHMIAGQKAALKVDSYPDRRIKGHLDSIQKGTGARFSLLPAENATGNFVKVVQRIPVKVLLDEENDPAHPLVPGMSVVIKIKVK